MKLKKRKCEVLPPGRNNLIYQHRLLLLWKKPVISCTVLVRVLPADWGRWSFSSAKPWWHLECWVQCWAPQYKRGMNLMSIQQRPMKVIKGQEHLSREGWESWDCFAWRRKGPEGSYWGIWLPDGRSKNEGARFFLVVPGDRAGGNGHRLEYRKFYFSIRSSMVFLL